MSAFLLCSRCSRPVRRIFIHLPGEPFTGHTVLVEPSPSSEPISYEARPEDTEFHLTATHKKHQCPGS